VAGGLSASVERGKRDTTALREQKHLGLGHPQNPHFLSDRLEGFFERYRTLSKLLKIRSIV